MDDTRIVTVEVVGRFSVPRRMRARGLAVARTLSLPLIAPSPTGTQQVEAEFLTFQARISEGDFYLPPLPYARGLHPLADTRERVVGEVLDDHRVGHGVPGNLDQRNALVRRILAALDEHERTRDASTPDA